ncbi:MAG: SpoIIE family protein phosphatase [bacterium]
MESSPEFLPLFSSTSNKNMQCRDDILKKLYLGLHDYFTSASITIYLLDPLTQSFFKFYVSDDDFFLSESEQQWALNFSKQFLSQHDFVPFFDYYISNRLESPFLDTMKFSLDKQTFSYDCLDALFLFLFSEQGSLNGFVFIHDWENKRSLSLGKKSLLSQDVKDFVLDMVAALDTFFVHQKITNLLVEPEDFHSQFTRKDSVLESRILELTVLNDTSNALGYALTVESMVKLIFSAMNKLLNVEVASIFLYGLEAEAKFFFRDNCLIDSSLRKSIEDEMIMALSPFLFSIEFNSDIPSDVYRFYAQNIKFDPLKKVNSSVNVPLIFKEKVLGILYIGSSRIKAFSKKDSHFLHTLSNQFSINLERLKIVKTLERSRMATLIRSMDDAVIVLGQFHQLELMNPVARKIFSFDSENVDRRILVDCFKSLGIWTLYQQVLEDKKPLLNQKIELENFYFSVNINPVFSEEGQIEGTVLVFRDITDMLLMDKIKTQRLEVISKVNLIIKSITDLDNLLIVLIEFILNVSRAEMGSILLKEGDQYVCKIHSNFPEKIRKMYRYIDGEAISDAVIRSKKLSFVDDYLHSDQVSSSIKILLDWYLCIPIVVHNNLIGVINLAKKCEGGQLSLTQEDINTLTTITNLSGTAIHNAMLFEQNLANQKLEQELKIANEIQSKLLPLELPVLPNISLAALSVPAREIGGDYYDFFKLESGDVGIVLADIVGKGIPAGLFMAMLKSILKTHLPYFNSPKKALEKINAVLLKEHIIDKFVPLFYGILNLDTMKFTYSNAGHEPVILLSKGQFQQLDTLGLPLAAVLNSEYEEKTITLLDRDLLVFLTDGFVEVKHFDKGVFGLERLKQSILEFSSMDMDAFVQKLYQRVQNFSGSGSQQDDLTLIALNVDFQLGVPELRVAVDVKKVSVKSHKRYISYIRNIVEQFAKKMGFLESDIYNLKLAVNEAQANIIEHAYFEKEDGDIIFVFSAYVDCLKISIRDFGVQMDKKNIEHRLGDLNELEGSGLGLYLIKSFVDKLHYITHTQGTELCLVKYLNKGVSHGNYH